MPKFVPSRNDKFTFYDWLAAHCPEQYRTVKYQNSPIVDLHERHSKKVWFVNFIWSREVGFCTKEANGFYHLNTNDFHRLKPILEPLAAQYEQETGSRVTIYQR